VTVVAADGVTTRVYKITLKVAYSNDTSLATFTVNGNSVVDGNVVTLNPYDEAVEVEVAAKDDNATFVLTGDSDLKNGSNKLVVTVTAHNGDVKVYTVTLIVPLSADTSLSEFTVGGDTVKDGATVILPPYTDAVEVVATPTDEHLEAQITGVDGLVTGADNVLKVTVTAPNGDVKVYTVTLLVPFSSDTSLSEFTVGGETVQDGDIVTLDPYTEAVEVVATPTDERLEAQVSGVDGLVTGADNLLKVTVTAPNGSVKVHTVTLRIPLSSDTSFASFTVNGEDVDGGSVLELDANTESVEVLLESTDVNAVVVVSGDTNLKTGVNTLKVTVTAPSKAKKEYLVTLKVKVSTDTSLSLFTVNGEDVAAGDVYTVEPHASSAEIVAEATDKNAVVAIEGGTKLVNGLNNVKVTVTAASGDREVYTMQILVPLSSETGISEIKVYGEVVEETLDLPAGSRAVPVEVTTVDMFASFEVSGNTELKSGENVVTITVTAPDGTSEEHTFVVNVLAYSDDASVASATVAGIEVVDDAVTLPAGSRAAIVDVVTTDPFATYSVEGNEAFETGDNEVIATVTAADGETTAEYVITVTVPAAVLSADASLESLTVAGQEALESLAVTVPAGTRAVTVVAVTTDPFASYVVDGGQELAAGANDVTVTVTAADGTTSEVKVVVTVTDLQLLDDVTLSTFLVNGVDALQTDAIELPYGTSRVNVKVETTNATSSYIVTGDGRLSPLVTGENQLVVTVTAANGDSEQYVVTLTVLEISKNNNLDPDAGLFVNGQAVDLEVLNSTSFVNLPVNTKIASIQAKAESSTADVIANGKNMLPTVARVFAVENGVNEISIQVIPEAGNSFSKTYVLKVFVGGADASLKTLKVNNTTLTIGEDGSANLQTPLANGTTVATLFIEPTVAEAKVEVDAGSATATKSSNIPNTWTVFGLSAGENTIDVTVTPADANAEPASYSILIPIALSSDKRLKTFAVDGKAVTPGSTIILEKGVTSAEISGVTESEVATFEVSGGDELAIGINTLAITVTAEDETTQEYKVTAIVPRQIETIVVGFSKAGAIKVDKASNAKGIAAITAGVKKVKGTVVLVKITNNFLLARDKPTVGPLRATNVQKYLQALKTNSFKTAIYQQVADPNAKKAKGTTARVYWY